MNKGIFDDHNAEPPGMDGVDIDKIVDSLKRVLFMTQNELESSGIIIKRIKLSLKSIISTYVGQN